MPSDTLAAVEAISGDTRRRIIEQVHGASETLSAQLAAAQVLVVPRNGHVTHEGPVFPPDTREFFQFLSDNLPQGTVELASTDEEYRELELHAADVWLPTLLIVAQSPNAVAVYLGVLSNWIYDRLKGLADRAKGHVHSTLVVDTHKGTFKMTYEGPVSAYVDSMKAVLPGAFAALQATGCHHGQNQLPSARGGNAPALPGNSRLLAPPSEKK